MNKYYLETSAIIALGSRLPSLCANCYTSALVIFELIASIDEKKFQRRKATINAVLSSGIEVVWRMPNEILRNAFPNIGVQGLSEGELIRILSYQICTAATFNEAYDLLQVHPFSLNLIKEVDNKLGKESVDNAMEWLRDHNRLQEGMYIVTVDKLLNSILNYFCPSFTDEQKVTVRKNYDGSIDKFVTTMCLYQSFQMNARNRPANNDWIDLHHTLYLRNQGKFVTNDKIQFNVINAVLENTALTVSDFQKLNTNS